MLTVTSSFFCSGRVPALLVLVGLLANAAVSEAQGFYPMTVYRTSTSPGAYSVQVGDVTGDGIPDIVTAETAHGVGVLPGLGGGLFGPVIYQLLGQNTSFSFGGKFVVLGDVTGDGRMDIVAAPNISLSVVGVLPGLAVGGFGPYTEYSTGPTGTVGQVVLGDMNSDGRLDIVAVNQNPNTVAILLAQAGGSFGTPTTYTLSSIGWSENLALGDINGDGRLDVAVAIENSTGASSVAVLLSQVGAGLGQATSYSVPGSLRNVVLADVTADGRLDLLVNASNMAHVAVLPGLAGGSFGAATNYATGGGGWGMVVKDADNDGRSDIVVVNTTIGSVGILAGQANGSFAAMTSYYSFVSNGSSTRNSRPNNAAVEDVNSDGLADIITANGNDNEVGVFLAIGPLPIVTGFNPPAGATGTALTLTGRDLRGTQLIRFSGSANNTVSSGFVVNAAGTQISNVIVPVGAVSGPITVQKAGGTATTIGSYTVQRPTGTAAASAGAAIQLSPNPAHTTCTLSGLPASATPATATLYNAVGQLVRTVALVPAGGQAALSVAGLPVGVYAVRLQVGGLAVVRRLVVE